MFQEEIHSFLDNFKYFTAILVLCFNSPFPSKCSHFGVDLPFPLQRFCSDPPSHHADVILERSLNQFSIRDFNDILDKDLAISILKLENGSEFYQKALSSMIIVVVRPGNNSQLSWLTCQKISANNVQF